MLLEFNIAPNTQIGRINIWNPTKAVCNSNNVRGIQPGKEYWLRRDTEDNLFMDIYADKNYKEFVTRLIIPEYDKKGNVTNKLIAGSIFYDKEWDIKSVDMIYPGENAFNTDHYTRAGEFVENLVSNNIIEFSKRWLHLGGFKDVSEDMIEYMKLHYKSYSLNGWYGFTHYYKDTGILVECPIKDMGNVKAISPIRFDSTPEKPFRIYKDMKRSNVNIYGN